MLYISLTVILMSPLLVFQHSLTSTADLVLDRLSQKVSALTAGCELESTEAQDTEENDSAIQRD